MEQTVIREPKDGPVTKVIFRPESETDQKLVSMFTALFVSGGFISCVAGGKSLALFVATQPATSEGKQ